LPLAALTIKTGKQKHSPEAVNTRPRNVSNIQCLKYLLAPTSRKEQNKQANSVKPGVPMGKREIKEEQECCLIP